MPPQLELVVQAAVVLVPLMVQLPELLELLILAAAVVAAVGEMVKTLLMAALAVPE
jgi:hypothetical protein